MYIENVAKDCDADLSDNADSGENQNVCTYCPIDQVCETQNHNT